MERKRERRTLLLAIVASILLHFAVAISLASFGDKLQPSLPQDEEKPSELTLVDLPPTPPVVNKNAPFIDTPDRKSTRLNSSHLGISYAVFCLKKKKNK